MNKEELATILFASIDRQDELKKLSDKELAQQLIELVWAEFNIFSYESDLIEEAVNRICPGYGDDSITE